MSLIAKSNRSIVLLCSVVVKKKSKISAVDLFITLDQYNAETLPYLIIMPIITGHYNTEILLKRRTTNLKKLLLLYEAKLYAVSANNQVC